MCNPATINGTGTAASAAAKEWHRADADDATRKNVVQVNNVDGGGGEKKSALRRMTPAILSGYLFNTLLYAFLSRGPPLLPPNLAAASQYCPVSASASASVSEEEDDHDDAHPSSCMRRDLLAFQAVSFLNLSFLGLVGVHSFFASSKRPGVSLPRSPPGRILGGPLIEADVINAAIVVFQGWDFFASLAFEEHRSAIMLVHHLLAFTCGYFSLMYEVLPYYAVYFGGVCEFSSIFLCISDIFQVHPTSSLALPPSTMATSLLSSILSLVEISSQAAFVVTFFAFRIVGWAYMSFMFISDASYVMRNGLAKTHRPGCGWFLWYMMTMAVLLGSLQVYWLKVILDKVSEMFE